MISPGGVGYDINCGVRLLASRPPGRRRRRASARGSPTRSTARSRAARARRATTSSSRTRSSTGACATARRWAVAKGMGEPRTTSSTRRRAGALAGARPDLVSTLAKDRGRDQLGTLGSGNHFLEVDRVAEVYDEAAAAALGLVAGADVRPDPLRQPRASATRSAPTPCRVMRHAADGARHRAARPAARLRALPLRRRASATSAPCARRSTSPSRNRQVIAAPRARRPSARCSARARGCRQVYDVCHNIAKLERHVVGGTEREVVVHRKGATRAFPPGHPLTPAAYREVGQPVLVPGDMGRYSFVLVGHGGRVARDVRLVLPRRGPAPEPDEGAGGHEGSPRRGASSRRGGSPSAPRAAARSTRSIPGAYKDVADVVDVVAGAGLARLVARLEPFCVVKG